MGLKHIIRGVLTYVPELDKILPNRTGGTNSARYCYSVWLRHLILAQKANLSTCPRVVAEFGPGDSLGIGLAALLSGAQKYYAFDVVEYADTAVNLDIFDELIELFNKRETIPDQNEFPSLEPKLESYEFPQDILTDDKLRQNLAVDRIQTIRKSLIDSGLHGDDVEIRYIVPWHDDNIIERESVDMIFSQAVLEHVDDLAHTYEAFYRWLKPDGFMSHQIDFGSHHLAERWNGHWAYSDVTWKLIKGKRPYLLNREPYSTHKRLLESTGFEIVDELRTIDRSGLVREQLNLHFRQLFEEDLVTRTVHILARKTPQ
jgi:SAM-dependent methyltransferase